MKSDMNPVTWNPVMTAKGDRKSLCTVPPVSWIRQRKIHVNVTLISLLLLSSRLVSDSSGSDSDSDSDMETEPKKKLTPEEREKALIAFDAMNEDEEPAPTTILHTANEILQLPEVKRPDIKLGPDAKLEVMGTVMSIVDNVVVIQAAQSGEVRVLDSGTIAAFLGAKDENGIQSREVLGEVRSTSYVSNDLPSLLFCHCWKLTF